MTFLMPEHAVKAFKELDGTVLHGRMLHLLPGKSKDKPDIEGKITCFLTFFMSLLCTSP